MNGPGSGSPAVLHEGLAAGLPHRVLYRHSHLSYTPHGYFAALTDDTLRDITCERAGAACQTQAVLQPAASRCAVQHGGDARRLRKQAHVDAADGRVCVAAQPTQQVIDLLPDPFG